MGFGDAVAKTYLFPEQQAAQRQPRAAAASASSPDDFKWDDYGLGVPKDELQTTGALAQRTAKYYKDLSELRQFAKTMKVQYGIDVLAPDHHNPNAVLAAETFKQRIGLLLAEHNLARRGATRENQFAPAISQGTFMPSQNFAQGNDYASALTNLGYATTLNPGSKQLASDLGGVKNLNAAGVKEANAALQGDAAHLYQIAATYPEGSVQRDYFMNQADMMARQRTIAAENNPSAFETMFGQKLRTGEAELRRIINHKMGNFTDAKAGNYYSDGTFWRENKDFNGTDIGMIPVRDPKTGKEIERRATIDKTVENPKTGEVRWIFKEKDVPPMDIKNTPVKTILGYLKGINRTAIDEYLAQHPEMVDKSGNVIESPLYDPDEKGIIKSAREQSKTQAQSRNDVAEKEISDIVDETSGFFGGTTNRFSAKYNKDVVIKRKGDEWSIDNIKELIPGKPRDFYDNFKKMTKTDLVSALSELGIQSFHEQLVKQPTNNGVVNTTPQEGTRAQFKEGWAVFKGGKWVLE